MDEFSPIETLETALRRWWLVALFIICGGAVGWLVHLAQPPLYEAKVVFSAVVDFKQAGQIVDLQQDKTINVVHDTILSKDVTDLVVADAKAAGIKVDGPALLAMATLERKSEIWELRIRYFNPQQAQTLANLWADRSYATLKEDLQHAINADALSRQLATLSMCMQQVNQPGNPMSPCENVDQTEINTQIKQVSDRLITERLASGGLASWLLFDLQQKAELPTQPIAYNVNVMVLAGGIIGFLLAIWAITAQLPDRLARLFFPSRSHRKTNLDPQPLRPDEVSRHNQ